ncbi:TIM barrel protein, partial [Streptomyces sp. SID12501]|uniref:TIM barrel protein n=1 Tax=Streptomyces sp. SID12501 TaxID=2706042 RepID=UPI0019412BCB
MHAVPVVPSGVERTFGRDEIIVSKTDPRGRITYANDVFLRVSGYAEADLLGRPHNVIRHPDMPRAVFQVLWDAIGGYDVGVCLDTCHAWAAGEDLETIVERLTAITGRIDLVHANSSRDPHGSSRDRHASFADGTIP